jgi:sugar/nucleoside kinase (ribokinase family)
MILDFGYVCMELHTSLPEDLQANHHQPATKTTLQVGGHAGLQSIAAARAGARVSLISALSNDLMSKTITDTLRREGIISSAMAYSEKSTGITQIIKSGRDNVTAIETTGAHEEIKADQIAKTVLVPRHLVLLHDDVAHNENEQVLGRTKESGAKSIMSFKKAPESSLLEILDIALICGNKDISTTSSCQIISVKEDGFDCFCGTFAACIQAGYKIDKAMLYANCAQTLYSESPHEGYAALPYLGDIQERIKAT